MGDASPLAVRRIEQSWAEWDAIHSQALSLKPPVDEVKALGLQFVSHDRHRQRAERETAKLGFRDREPG